MVIPPDSSAGIPDLSRLYGADFFRDWGATNQKYLETAGTIASVLYERFHPRRMVDIGSGSGIYASTFRGFGVEVVALDGVIPPPEHSLCPPDFIRDFREPVINEWGIFDTTFCFEVIEHIPPDRSEIFLDNLGQFGDLLLLSYAPPGQGGTGHFNEQPKRYWVGKLAEHGFTYDKPATGSILEYFKGNKTPYMWMTENICVFRRREKEKTV